MSGPAVRVLHLIDELDGGGSERWLYDIVRLTPKEAVRHRVVCILPDRGDFVYAPPLSELGAYNARAMEGRFLRALESKIGTLVKSGDAVVVRRSLALVLRSLRAALVFRRVATELIRFRPDVIHGHLVRGLLVGRVLRRLSGYPLIHTVPALFAQMEDAGFGWMPEVYSNHSSIDCFFTGASRSELAAVGVPAERVIWIDGVVDLARTDCARAERVRHRNEVRVEHGMDRDAPIAVSVGRLHPSKGHAFALEALPAILRREPALHWIVVGEGQERERLEQRARELGVENHVHLVGFRPDPLPFYAAADLYLRPHLIEGENLSSFTAMAFGLPVVGFDTGAENELVRIVGHGLLAENRDVGAFGAAAISLITQKDCGAALGARGNTYAVHHLDIRGAIDQFGATYRRLAESRAPRSRAFLSKRGNGEERTI